MTTDLKKTFDELGEEIVGINRANGWDVCKPSDWVDSRSNEARLAEWTIDEPHFIKPDSDCMGNPTPGYWRSFARLTDDVSTNGKNVVVGHGPGKGEALHNVRANILARGDAYKLCTLLALVTTEVAEAIEAVRKRDQQNFIEEMADVVIRALDITHGLGLDLASAVVAKLEKNRKRGFRHGGKVV